jgi:hypothetical protein
LYTSPIIITSCKLTRMRLVEHVERVGGMRNAHKILVAKRVGKRPLGRPRYRWEDSIRMGIRGKRVGRCGLDASCSG